ncbi:GIY-YIG nuclease family protein [Brachyspira pilosicoli]|uniref:GIY-YIG nuclease family protein n=1 Tax=Brachyspira pilosicoli TaxID=52584 RepID=UPI001C67243D|nr:GIY-YIG nuclease family protein [Brachyspira pilosicoli]MBW5383380.1 GIY-YIG nuclease family protein [Brachyspira pilosicoli]
MENEFYYVYILLCEDGSYYTGITNNLKERFIKHSKGKGAKYTKTHKPIKFLSAWRVENISIALKIEHYIKKQDKKTKTMFIENKRLLKKYFLKEYNELNKISVISVSNMNS